MIRNISVLQTSGITVTQYQAQRNQNAEVRSQLASYVASLPVSDVSSISLISSVLSQVTRQPEEIDQNTAVNQISWFFVLQKLVNTRK